MKVMKTSYRWLLPAVLAVARVLAADDSALLAALKSPIILQGDSHTAYRDPMLFHYGDTFHLLYSYVREEEDHLVYWYVAVSTSPDLRNWSPSRTLTPKDQNLNYCGPGNVVTVGDEWFLSLCSYPIVNFRRGDKLRFGDDRARIFTMRSRDLKTWSAPELIKVKGPEVSEKDMGMMIDPFLLRDKDEPGRWWCLFKQAGKLRSAASPDLKTWVPTDVVLAYGENPCVLVDHREYVLFYAPRNGVGVKRSADLRNWREEGPPITLGQKDWPWAETRLTAGYVEDMRDVPGVGKFVLVCHSMGPGKIRTDANTNAGCSIVIAWSEDLKTWRWPDENSSLPW